MFSIAATVNAVILQMLLLLQKCFTGFHIENTFFLSSKSSNYPEAMKSINCYELTITYMSLILPSMTTVFRKYTGYILGKINQSIFSIEDSLVKMKIADVSYQTLFFSYKYAYFVLS